MSDYIVIHGIKVHKDHANFVPETFGRLTTIGPRFLLPTTNANRYKSYHVCQCSCGLVVVCRTDALKSNRTSSCGCLQTDVQRIRNTTHGKSQTAEYGNFKGILARCYNTNSQAYGSYGGRGIGVCARWREPNGQGYLNFVTDMGPCPGPDYTVDRFPNKNGDYCPENCRWATRKEQARNTRTNKMLTAFGKTQCLAAWAEEYAIHHNTLSARIARGIPVEQALLTPTDSTKSRNRTRKTK